MIVMLNHSRAHDLHAEYPGRIAMLIGPSRLRPTHAVPFALDNGRFRCWTHGTEWDETAFIAMLDRYSDPVWVVVPDMVGDAALTFAEWDKWAPILRERGLRLALAVQDGMTPESVRRYTDPNVVFVGGTTEWKRSTVWQWCHEFDAVHVGRVNTEKWLWNAHRCGAASCDGTGWFRGDRAQYRGLIRYLDRSQRGLTMSQMELAFAAAPVENEE